MPETSLTINPHVTNVTQSPLSSSHPLAPLEKALQDILPQNTEENTVVKTRRILGEKAKSLSDEQIECAVTEFQFLITNWLDEFEKDIFNGMTLKEVLNEK